MALTKEQQLEELKTALHSLLTGKRSVRITYGERTVQFSEVNIDELKEQIAKLEQEVAAPAVVRRPFSVRW